LTLARTISVSPLLGCILKIALGNLVPVDLRKSSIQEVRVESCSKVGDSLLDFDLKLLG
jgi:hypothetical protein